MSKALITIQRWWLFLFVVAIPFSTGYIVERPIAFSWVNLFSLVFITLGIVNGLRGAIPFRTVKDKGALAVIALFFIVLAYALFFTHPLRNGIGLWGSRLVQPALVGYFVYLMLEARVLQAKELMACFFLTLIPQIIGGALQFFHVLPFHDTNRVTVAYRWPNTFARYIMVMLLLGAPLLLAKLSKRWLAAGWAVWGVGVLLLLSSISYNGTVSFAIGLLVILLALPRAYRRLQLAAVGTVIILSLVVVLNAAKLPKWQMSVTSSKETRLEFWSVAIGAIRDQPWTGIGLKGWEQHYPTLLEKYGVPPFKSLTSPQPHNFILDSLLKAGIPGLVAIPLFLLLPAILGFRLLRKVSFEEGGWLGVAGMAASVALFSFGAIDDPLWSDDMMPLLFMVIALLTAALHASRKKSVSMR